jgi:hypothetical protein
MVLTDGLFGAVINYIERRSPFSTHTIEPLL